MTAGALSSRSSRLGALARIDLFSLLAWPLVKAAATMLTEMSSFESAGVSGPA